MKIRSVTYTIDLNKVLNLEYNNRVQQRIEKIRNEFKKDNVEIRTVRFNTFSFRVKGGDIY